MQVPAKLTIWSSVRDKHVASARRVSQRRQPQDELPGGSATSCLQAGLCTPLGHGGRRQHDSGGLGGDLPEEAQQGLLWPVRRQAAHGGQHLLRQQDLPPLVPVPSHLKAQGTVKYTKLSRRCSSLLCSQSESSLSQLSASVRCRVDGPQYRRIAHLAAASTSPETSFRRPSFTWWHVGCNGASFTSWP